MRQSGRASFLMLSLVACGSPVGVDMQPPDSGETLSNGEDAGGLIEGTDGGRNCN